jgi:ribosome-associated heat shock protein Hsp15
MIEKVRVDKWLWTIRVFKSRNMATQACKSGKVKVASTKCKPARNIVSGDHISVDKDGLKLEFKVLELLKSRMSFSIAKEAYEDLTSEAEKEKFRAFHHRRLSGEDRQRGIGRPTKRDRREIENFKAIDEWLDKDLPYDFGGV